MIKIELPTFNEEQEINTIYRCMCGYKSSNYVSAVAHHLENFTIVGECAEHLKKESIMKDLNYKVWVDEDGKNEK